MTMLVLLSGGMDSTTAMSWAADQDELGGALSINYGQRHIRELESAEAVAKWYDAPHYVLDLSGWGRMLTGSALTDPDVELPYGHYAAETMRATIVPNRNATMLNAAAGVAMSLGHGSVVTAIHAGDHAVYPDCRPEFLESLNETLGHATEGAIEVLAPFVHISKTDIARLGSKLHTPFGLTWSCYEGGDLHCGRCGTCTERIEAFHDAGIFDPTEYRSWDLTPAG